MSVQTAKQRLLIHAGFELNPAQLGFLGRLRPYQGLDECDFAEIVESILELHPVVVQSKEIDRRFIAALWWICDRSRVLVLDPKSSVQRNGVASQQDIIRLDRWIDVIESMSNRMLQGNDLPMCMYRLLEYLSRSNTVEPSCFTRITDYIVRCVSYDDSDVAEEAKRALLVVEGKSHPSEE